jgi:hypothetical protein
MTLASSLGAVRGIRTSLRAPIHGIDQAAVDGEFPIVRRIAVKETRSVIHRIRTLSGFTLANAHRAAAHQSTWRAIEWHPTAVGHHTSGGDRCLIQPTTVHLPAIRTDARAGATRA